MNPDREQAAWKHEAIRRRLIAFFDCRGCADPEGLADETVNRVIRQITSLTTKFEGEPARYFYGVAHYVHLEYLERHVKRDGGPLTEAMRAPAFSTQDDERELRLACLDRCLQKLQPEEREMITEYYLEDKQAKIDHRRRLAERFGYSVNALRIKAHRLRGELYDCIMDCLRRQPKF